MTPIKNGTGSEEGKDLLGGDVAAGSCDRDFGKQTWEAFSVAIVFPPKAVSRSLISILILLIL